ncbi:PREDICTED: uncharacterized protein LOC108611939 isoform X2 [Drosophila arizonae]|uniref:Uncharacterized protein LOC108611939 isoform X2 n=1 Tax=Drosophila arizonae TaxID=7263 RepID=A0ABM1NZ97_DROAR|nr:PREDICTED: uncharacterized protein LOC108611939 isoform X2 [Drosophila arizonae]
MKLKCVAKISSVYWQSNEESVESDKHQRIPVLESRETVRQLDKSLEAEKQLKKSRRPAAATSVAAAASSATRVSAWLGCSRILAFKSIARIALYALPVLIAFLCNAADGLGRGSSNKSSCCQHDRRLLVQLSVSTPCR